MTGTVWDVYRKEIQQRDQYTFTSIERVVATGLTPEEAWRLAREVGHEAILRERPVSPNRSEEP